MNFQESVEWLILLGADTIPGKTKIECIKLILEKEPNLIRKKILLDSFLKKIVHPSGEFSTHSHYYRLEHYYHRLKENPAIIKEKSGWEEEIEVPLRRLFKRLEMPFYFKSSLEFKKAVIRQYEEWNLYHKYDYFGIVVEYIEMELSKIDRQKDTIKFINQNKKTPQKLTFGFQDTEANLKYKIHQLCQKVDLLNWDETKEQDLINLLTSKNIYSCNKIIRINCETAVFRYILEKLKPYFTNLAFSNIEKSQLFRSKLDNPITAQNLYSSKINNPKLKTIIDQIFKE
jgi:hypothetical protein